jgi:hypothetical protein
LIRKRGREKQKQEEQETISKFETEIVSTPISFRITEEQ